MKTRCSRIILLVIVSYMLLFFLAVKVFAETQTDIFENFLENGFSYKLISFTPRPNGIHCQMQGACTDGHYIWAGFNHRKILIRLDLTSWEIEEREYSDDSWMCGHINDMVYNPNSNNLYVVAYEEDNWLTRGNIAILDPITLEYKGMMHIKRNGEMLPIYSMLYDRIRDRYIVTIPGTYGKENAILDADFQYVGPFVLERDDPNILGGIDTDGEYLYRSIWKDRTSNVVTVYDMDGHFISEIDLGIPGRQMEAEGIMYDWNGRFFINCSHRDGTGGSIYYIQINNRNDKSIIENLLGQVALPIDYTL